MNVMCLSLYVCVCVPCLCLCREGATIRNQHTLCNNLFPIFAPPPSVISGENTSSTSTSGRSAHQAMLSAMQRQFMSGHDSPSPSPPPTVTAPSSTAPSSSALLNPTSSAWDSNDIDQSFERY